MSKRPVVLLFPGQGSQYVGMGTELFKSDAKALAETANEVLGFNLSGLMEQGPEDDLKLTKFTQPAIVTHSVAVLQKVMPLLETKGFDVTNVLGHSVGEYAALVAAGVLSFKDAVKAVHLRGQYMQEAVPAGKGKMIAILRADESEVVAACEAATNEENGSVQPANFNDPGQVVISGTAQACDKAVEWLTENAKSRFRATPLAVSAPFHSSLMAPATEKLAAHLKTIEFKSLNKAYVANVDAKIYPVGTTGDVVRENLVKQVEGSVLWTQSVKNLPNDSLCLEIGPGRVLKGLLRKINPELQVISLDQDGAWEELEEALS